MKSILTYWKNRASGYRTTRIILAGVATVVIISGAAGVWYWFHLDNQQTARAAEQKKIAGQQRRISDFYRNVFSGADMTTFLTLMTEIKKSRLPFELIGYSESEYQCTSDGCQFIYQLNPQMVYATTDKYFHGKKYEGTFTEETLNFSQVASEMNDNPYIRKFNNNAPVSAASCNDILNYIYSYNSLRPTDDKITISKLPASSVTADERAMSLFPHSYQLLAGEWNLSLPEQYPDILFFAHSQAYRESFIIQRVASDTRKAAQNDPAIQLQGVFICKN